MVRRSALPTLKLVAPPSVQRQAGIKSGDRVEFQASARTITIEPVEPMYKPTKAEWAAIRKGEAAIARGDSVSLTEFLNVDSHSRKTRAKGSRKFPADRETIRAAAGAMAADPFSGDDAKATIGSSVPWTAGSSINAENTAP